MLNISGRTAPLLDKIGSGLPNTTWICFVKRLGAGKTGETLGC